MDLKKQKFEHMQIDGSREKMRMDFEHLKYIFSY